MKALNNKVEQFAYHIKVEVQTKLQLIVKEQYVDPVTFPLLNIFRFSDLDKLHVKNQEKNVEINLSHQSSSDSGNLPQDELYNPAKYPKVKNKRIKIYSPVNLKQSLLQQFFTFLCNQKRSKCYAKKTFQILKMEWTEKTFKRCLTYFNQIRSRYANALREDILKSFKPEAQGWEESEQIQNFKTVARMLTFYFYTSLFALRTLTSRKLQKSCRNQKVLTNLSKRRQVLKNLRSWYL